MGIFNIGTLLTSQVATLSIRILMILIKDYFRYEEISFKDGMHNEEKDKNSTTIILYLHNIDIITYNNELLNIKQKLIFKYIYTLIMKS